MNSKSLPKKILVNGCSHTASVIPDLETDQQKVLSWTYLLSKNLNCELVNLASEGKSNLIILEETQRYLLNYPNIDYVIVQLTEWHRWSFFKNKYSFSFMPSDPESQFNNEFRDKNLYVKMPGIDPADSKISITDSHGNIKTHKIGDASLFYERLTTVTLLYNLYFYCSQHNIKLLVLPYESMGSGEELEDIVFKSIPSTVYLQENINIGLWDYLNINHQNSNGHFHSSAHIQLLEIITQYITTGTQIYINENLIKNQGNVVYDYTD
jgi:hypothetical protein